MLGAGWRIGSDQPLTGFDLHGMYAGLESARRNRVVASIDYLHEMTFLQWPEEGNAGLAVMVLREVEPIDEVFASAWEGWAGYRELPGVAAEVNRFVRHGESAADDEPPYAVCLLRRGRLLIDLRIAGADLSDRELARIVEAIFERLEAAALPGGRP